MEVTVDFRLSGAMKIIAYLVVCTISCSAHSTEDVTESPILDTQESQNTNVQTDSKEEKEIEHIIVTATRRKVSLQEISLSISVIGEDVLSNSLATKTLDYVKLVPGLVANRTFDFNKITLRGVSSSSFSEPQAVVGIYLDETPITHPGILTGHPDPHLIDVQRIEVLRGPQGTLYGAGAMGGVIKIIGNQPDMLSDEGWIDGSVSHTDKGAPSYLLQGMINLPITSQNAAIRGSIFKEVDGGFIDHINLGKDINNFRRVGGRIAGTWQATNNLKFTATIHGQNDYSGSTPRDDVSQPNYTMAGVVAEPFNDDWISGNLTIDYEMSHLHLVSSSSYMDRDSKFAFDLTNIFMPFAFGNNNPTSIENEADINEFSQEIRLFTVGNSNWQWLAGIFYQRRDFIFKQDTFSPGLDNLFGGLTEIFGAKDKLFVSEIDSDLKQLDIFAEVSYKINDSWRLTMGARRYDIEQTFIRDQLGFLLGGPGHFEGSLDDTDITSKLSVAYYPSNDTTIYSTIAEGYRPGGSNEIATDFCDSDLADIGLSEVPMTFSPDNLISSEIGLRHKWSEQKLYFNLAVYHIKRDNIPLTISLDCGTAFVMNAGKSVSDGGEMEITYLPTDSLQLTINGAYTDSHMVDSLEIANITKDDRIPLVPYWSLGAAATYTFAVLNNLPAYFRLDFTYVGKQIEKFGLDAFSGKDEIEAYSLFNLNIGWESDEWSYQIFSENILNKRISLFNHDNFLLQADFINRPRTIGMRLVYEF